MSSDNEVKVPRKEIESIIEDMLKGGKYVRENDISRLLASGEREQAGHTHKPEEFMPSYVKSYKCPDGKCGQIHSNPNYKKAITYCSDCGSPFGTIEDAKKAPSCSTCGSVKPAIAVLRPNE